MACWGNVLPSLRRFSHLCLPWVVVARLKGYRLRHLNSSCRLAWIGRVLSLKGARIDCLARHVEVSCTMRWGLLRGARVVFIIASCRWLRLLSWLMCAVQLPVAITAVGLLQTLQLFLSLSWLEKKRWLVTTLERRSTLGWSF